MPPYKQSIQTQNARLSLAKIEICFQWSYFNALIVGKPISLEPLRS
jgi:hypothetical protein